jgi:hypothetical protein
MDYRNSTAVELRAMFEKLRSSGQDRQALINDLAKVAVFHSLKDGQITPARSLHGALGRTDAAKEVVDYLQKYGNLGWGVLDKASKAKGVIFRNKQNIEYTEANKEKNLDIANKIYESLPDVWEVFISEPRELQDFDFDKALKRLAQEMRKRYTAGKQVLFANPEEEKIAKEILEAVPAA